MLDQFRLRRNRSRTRQCRFLRGRLIVGKRHCRVLISDNINSDAIGIDINQSFRGGLEAHPTRKENSVFVEEAGKPVLQKYSKYWIKTEQGHF